MDAVVALDGRKGKNESDHGYDENKHQAAGASVPNLSMDAAETMVQVCPNTSNHRYLLDAYETELHMDPSLLHDGVDVYAAMEERYLVVMEVGT